MSCTEQTLHNINACITRLTISHVYIRHFWSISHCEVWFIVKKREMPNEETLIPKNISHDNHIKLQLQALYSKSQIAQFCFWSKWYSTNYTKNIYHLCVTLLFYFHGMYHWGTPLNMPLYYLNNVIINSIILSMYLILVPINLVCLSYWMIFSYLCFL